MQWVADSQLQRLLLVWGPVDVWNWTPRPSNSAQQCYGLAQVFLGPAKKLKHSSFQHPKCFPQIWVPAFWRLVQSQDPKSHPPSTPSCQNGLSCITLILSQIVTLLCESCTLVHILNSWKAGLTVLCTRPNAIPTPRNIENAQQIYVKLNYWTVGI